MPEATTATQVVTDEQAQEVLDAIVAHFGPYFEPITEADGKVLAEPAALPVIRRDERGHAVIWWEEGPSDWATEVTQGGSTEETRALYALASQELRIPLKIPEPEPVTFSDAVHVEPYMSFSVGVYPA